MGCNHVPESFLQFINVSRSSLLEIALRGWGKRGLLRQQ